METKLQVKKSFPQREEKILVAMDVTLRKIEKLSLITSLCHSLMLHSQENDGEFTVVSAPSKPLETVLGKEIHGILEQLVSFLKMAHNESTAQKVAAQTASLLIDEGAISGEILKLGTHEPICNIRQDSDIRAFLCKTLEKVEAFVKDKSYPVPSPHGISASSTTTSTMGLLHKALSGKYREHVLRCLKEFDEKSLLSILYLVANSEEREDEDPSTKFMSEVDEEIESYYILQQSLSPPNTGSDRSESSIRWDIEKDEEIVDGEKETQGEWEFEKNAFEFNVFLEHIKDDSFTSNGEPLMLYSAATSEFVSLYGKLLSYTYPQSVAKRIVKLEGGVHNFLKFMNEFRSVATHNLHNYQPRLSNLQITYRLLLIRAEQLEKTLTQTKIMQEEKQLELDEQVQEWSGLVKLVKEEVTDELTNCIKEHIVQEVRKERKLEQETLEVAEKNKEVEETLSDAVSYVKKCTRSLRARRHWLEASLDALKRQYNSTMAKYKGQMDELGVEEATNAKSIKKLQKKFQNVEEMYDEMKAMRRLKELLANMEKAEAIKQNWAARKIQVAWRKYKVAKLRKKKLKGRKKGGKKKTPPPNQGKAPSPSKVSGSTPTSRSKSRSKTP